MGIKAQVRAMLGATTAAALVSTAIAADAAPQRKSAPSAARQPARVGTLPPGTQRPTREVTLSIGQGELITLPSTVADVWTSNPGAADVYVANPRQINLFGKEFGEATIFATNASGQVVYSANVRVAQNLTSLDRMMKLAIPEADIRITTVGQIAVLNGVVTSPEQSAQAERIALSALNPGVDASAPGAMLKYAVINRLKAATPLQVNLQVRFAEVSRSFVKNIGVNLTNRDSGSFLFGIAQGRQGSIATTPGQLGSGTIQPNGLLPGQTGFTFPSAPQAGGTLLAAAGRFLGTDLLASLDLGETIGQVSTLANPNLTALSGETGSFLAGGEIPIPISQGLGAVSVEYKQYGVSISYTPTVLADGRISLRVRPEVSQLSSAGAVTLNGVQIPALTTRRAETTVELGSGQSLVIGGLLQNRQDNQITKAPGIGDIPILGALFRSNGFQRNETELMIVITPYLVKPVNASEIVLPTDGYKAPTDLERVFLGKLASGVSGEKRPMPQMVSPSAPPAIGAVAPVPAGPQDKAPANREPAAAPAFVAPKKGKGGSALPGFSLR